MCLDICSVRVFHLPRESGIMAVNQHFAGCSFAGINFAGRNFAGCSFAGINFAVHTLQGVYVHAHHPGRIIRDFIGRKNGREGTQKIHTRSHRQNGYTGVGISAGLGTFGQPSGHRRRVSILRAEGNDVRATARGYLPERKREQFPFVGTIVCRHDDSGLADELFTIVDYGGTCIDVTIEHAIYGELSGQLNIGSRYEAEQFIEKSRLYPDAKPLSLLSGGLHMHNVGAPSREVFDLICGRLREKGILVEISGE